MDEEKQSGNNEKRDDKFIRGMFCGVLLALACMALSMMWYRYRVERRLAQLGRIAQEAAATAETETESVLELDYGAVADKLQEMGDVINENFLEPIDAGQIEEKIYSGLLEGLDDPYSVYYSRKNLQTLAESTSGTYVGIGALLSQDPETGTVTVVSCFDDTPAAEAGLLPGDAITAVNQESVDGRDLSELVAVIKTEPGETLSLSILRDGKEQELTVERRDIKVPTVEYRMLEDHIGYLQIIEFDEVTVNQFQEALDALEESGMEKLIIDVRDNPGGVLQVVCDVLDKILPEGLIVYTQDKHGRCDEYFSDGKQSFDKPLAVLINENSASASEIFAGAVKDYGIGTLIGKTTFGKGIVQRVFNLSDGTGMKLTIAKYYTPGGTDIHEKGIAPDIEVEQDTEAGSEEDSQLQEAVRFLKEGEN